MPAWIKAVGMVLFLVGKYVDGTQRTAGSHPVNILSDQKQQAWCRARKMDVDSP
jgi:hypothetical protein